MNRIYVTFKRNIIGGVDTAKMRVKTRLETRLKTRLNTIILIILIRAIRCKNRN